MAEVIFQELTESGEPIIDGEWIFENYSSALVESYLTEFTREEVLAALAKGPVILRFTKKSTGKKRNMYCTRNLKLIPPAQHPQGNGPKSRDPNHIRVYDLITKAWRSFLLPSVDKTHFKPGNLGFLDRTIFRGKWKSKNEAGEFKGFGEFLTEAKKKTMYVRRKLHPESAKEIQRWAREVGLKKCLRNQDFHVTLIYSKTAVDWKDIELNEKELVLPKTDKRKLEFFGDILVMRLPDTPGLTSRHKYFLSKGAKSDFPDYKAHITISWDTKDVSKDIVKWLKPYDGKIILQGETRKEIDNSFTKPTEQTL